MAPLARALVLSAVMLIGVASAARLAEDAVRSRQRSSKLSSRPDVGGWAASLLSRAATALRRLVGLTSPARLRRDVDERLVQYRLHQYLGPELAGLVLEALPSPRCYQIAISSAEDNMLERIPWFPVYFSADSRYVRYVPQRVTHSWANPFLPSRTLQVWGTSREPLLLDVRGIQVHCAEGQPDAFLLLSHFPEGDRGVVATLATGCLLPEYSVGNVLDSIQHWATIWFLNGCEDKLEELQEGHLAIRAPDDPCVEVFLYCSAWARYDGAAGHLLDPLFVQSDAAGARLSPDGRSVVLYMRDRVLDYIWAFAEKAPPKLVQPPGAGRPHPRFMLHGPMFSEDSAFFVTNTDSDVLLYEVATGRHVLAVPMREPLEPVSLLEDPRVWGAALRGPLACPS